MESLLKAVELGRRYGQVKALDGLNLDLKAGEIYGLVGKNGAGKTTFLKLVSGMVRPSSGYMEIFGETKNLYALRRRIGTMIETPEFFPSFTAWENLQYFRIHRGIGDASRIEALLESVGLGDVGRKKFKAFSLGMKQRLGLALALMGQPDILLLDEPINGIDPVGIVQIREILRTLARERHLGIVISSHILPEVEQLATVYGILDKGRLVWELRADALAAMERHHIRLRVDKTERALVILEEKLGMKDYRVEADGSLTIFAAAEKVPEMTACLVGQGLRVMEIKAESKSLEDFYVEYSES